MLSLARSLQSGSGLRLQPAGKGLEAGPASAQAAAACSTSLGAIAERKRVRSTSAARRDLYASTESADTSSPIRSSFPDAPDDEIADAFDVIEEIRRRRGIS